VTVLSSTYVVYILTGKA